MLLILHAWNLGLSGEMVIALFGMIGIDWDATTGSSGEVIGSKPLNFPLGLKLYNNSDVSRGGCGDRATVLATCRGVSCRGIYSNDVSTSANRLLNSLRVKSAIN